MHRYIVYIHLLSLSPKARHRCPWLVQSRLLVFVWAYSTVHSLGSELIVDRKTPNIFYQTDSGYVLLYHLVWEHQTTCSRLRHALYLHIVNQKCCPITLPVCNHFYIVSPIPIFSDTVKFGRMGRTTFRKASLETNLNTFL